MMGWKKLGYMMGGKIRICEIIEGKTCRNLSIIFCKGMQTRPR